MNETIVPKGMTEKMQLTVEEQAALEVLRAGKAECVLLREGQAPIYGHGLGVKPLLQALDTAPETLRGAVLVDKVIGKAAALLAVRGGVCRAAALTASEAGLACLAAHGVPAAAAAVVPYIENRTHDGLCPLEQSVLDVDDPAAGEAAIRAAVARLMAAKNKEKQP